MRSISTFLILSLVLLEALLLSQAFAAAPSSVFERLTKPAEAKGLALQLDPIAVAGLRASAEPRLSLPLPDGGSVALELQRFELLTSDAVVSAMGDAGSVPISPDLTLYRGRMAGEPDSWAVLGFSRSSATGIVVRGARRYAISPRDRRGRADTEHEIVALSDLPQRTGGFECAADGLAAALETQPLRGALPRLPEGNSPRLLCRVAIDADYEFTANKFASDTAAAAHYLLTVMGVVSSIYERDLGVSVAISYLNLWTTSNDPYSQSTTQGSLTEFRNWWNQNRGSVSRNLAHLVSGRALGGGIANIGVLCNPSNAYAVSALDATYAYPNASATWDAYVLAHEMGHNFNSFHTHNCFWQQRGYVPNGALLDSCYAAEGSCYSGPVGTLPSDGKGTLMSYCHLVGGTTNGIRLDFHPACIAEMRQHAESCLGATTLQPARDPVAVAGPWSVQLAWTASSSPGIVRYDVYRSTYPDDPAPAFVGSTTGLSFTDANRLGTYWYKVRAATSGALAPFSPQAKVDVCLPENAAGWPAGMQTKGPVIADFNGDGIADVALANNNLSGTVSVLVGQGAGGVGNGSFNAPVSYPCNTRPVAIAAGDLDDDGILDLVVANDATVGTVSTLRGRGSGGVGNGSFDPPVRDTVGSRASAVAIADLDEDGVLDLAVANLASNSVSILLGLGTNGVGTATFGDRTDYAVGLQPVALETGDFDANGIVDLAVVCKSSGSVSVLRGQGAGGLGNGLFQPAVSYNVGSAAVAITTGDFDADGITDLAVARQVAAGQAVILRGQGSGGIGNGAFASGGSFACGPSPYGLLACDVNGNGVTDLVASNSGTTLASVMLGQGDGTFQSPQFFAGAAEAVGIASADFDADGTLDLGLATSGSMGFTTVRGSCPAALATTLDVSTPDGGEQWDVRGERVVTWSKGPAVASVDLEVSRDGGARWERIASHVTRTSFIWTVTPPATSGTTALLRVVDASMPARRSTSAQPFRIVGSTVSVTPGRVPALALRVLSLSGNVPSFAVTLPDGAPAALDLFDITGRRVASHAVGTLGAGTHVVPWNVGTVASGVYLARLTQSGASVTRKAVVAR